MSGISGTDLVVEIGGVQIDCLTANSLSLDKTIIDVTNKSSNGWREKITGVKNWTVSATANVEYDVAENFIEAFALFNSGAVGSISFGPSSPSTGDPVYSGSVLVSTLEKTADFDDAATYSVTFEGTGELTETITA